MDLDVKMELPSATVNGYTVGAGLNGGLEDDIRIEILLANSQA